MSMNYIRFNFPDLSMKIKNAHQISQETPSFNDEI